MARVRCYQMWDRNAQISGWSQHPRCTNCDAPLPIRRLGLMREDGEEPASRPPRRCGEPEAA